MKNLCLLIVMFTLCVNSFCMANYQNQPYNSSFYSTSYYRSSCSQYNTSATYNSTNTYRTSQIGYTTKQYSGVYKPFDGEYDTDFGVSSNNYENYSQPRKAPKASGGNGSYGGITVTYTVEADYFGILYYTVTYYYPDGTIAGTERIKSLMGGNINYDYLNSQAEKYAKKYYEEKMSMPIGDLPISSVILVSVIYILYKRKKQ